MTPDMKPERTIELTGNVSVSVIVNLDSGQVEQVIVDDESFQFDDNQGEYLLDSAVSNFDAVMAEVDQAMDIADKVDWPEWLFGW